MSLPTTRVLFTAAPLLLLAGQLVHPEEPTEGAPLYAVLREHRTSWLLAHLLLLAGVLCLGPVLLRLAAGIRPSAPRLSVLAAVGAVVGTGAAAALFGGSLVLAEAGGGSEAEMVAYLDRVLGSPVELLFLLVPALLVSVAVSSAVLASRGVVTRSSAVLATVGIAIGSGAPEPVACIGTSVAIVGLTLMANQLHRRPTEAMVANRTPAPAAR